MKNFKLLLPLLMGVIIFSQIAKADDHCRLVDTFPSIIDTGPMSSTVDLGGISLHVGPETPDGTFVFTSYINRGHPSIACGATPYISRPMINTQRIYDILPMPISTWGVGYYAGRVYETGVPGLGVSFENGDVSSKIMPYSISVMANAAIGNHGAIVMRIIKTGPVTPGVILGENLPTMSSFFTETPGFIGLPIKAQTQGFTGQINITSASCTTPDINVNLGSYNVADNFTGIGTSTPWVDSSLTLTNCPAFFGNYSGPYITSGPLAVETDIMKDNMAKKVANTLEVRITPSTSIIDSTQGLFAIKSGSGAASGVGLQLASGNYNETSSLSLINLASHFTQSVSSTTSTNVKIPLAVRYYQTDTTVTPGKADGMVTVDILYK
jgi:major type 1 subunit fimbrin (pilin)